MKKIFVALFFLSSIGNIYSQTVVTSQFFFLVDKVTASRFVTFHSTLLEAGQFDGYTRYDRLPNSIINEIDRQLRDYYPLENGQVFSCMVGRSIDRGRSVEVYKVILRITDFNNSQWEYFAYMQTRS